MRRWGSSALARAGTSTRLRLLSCARQQGIPRHFASASSSPLASFASRARNGWGSNNFRGFVFGITAVGGVVGGMTAACATADDDLPVYSKAEVAKHNNEKDGIWIVVGDYVYDVTEFVENHPGGREKIMLAAGSNVEPYWNVYRQHYKDQVADILAPFKIGKTNPEEWAPAASSKSGILNDPYSTDPERNPILIYHNHTPCNAEPPVELVASSFVTPNELFFVRNHSPVPVLDESNFKLVIKGREGQEDRTFTLEQLRSGFKRLESTTTVQCGGNRRKGLNEVSGKPVCSGTEWKLGAISTAKWGGVSLREVLDFCGHGHGHCKDKGVEHVVFEGADGVTASIPVQKALCPGECVLLAYEMNGEPLPRDHGYPLRVIVPGHVGIRNIKWVNHIECSKEEAKGPWQRGIAYKGFSPSQTSPQGVDVEKLVSLQEMPVQSAIVSPRNGMTAEIDEDDTLSVRGYAWSGGGRGIIRVDVSADGGNSWHSANLGEGHDQPLDRAWAWTLWDIEIPLPAGTPPGAKVDICCRATDASYNVQPETQKSIWNLRGIANNSSHHVVVPTKRI